MMKVRVIPDEVRAKAAIVAELIQREAMEFDREEGDSWLVLSRATDIIAEALLADRKERGEAA